MQDYNELMQRFKQYKNIVNKYNRFYCDSVILDKLEKNKRILARQLASGDLIYRGRIFNLDDKVSTWVQYQEWLNSDDRIFLGYDKKESGAPPIGLAKEGRLNGNGISFLYACDKIDTVIYELRPTVKEVVSVATLKVLRNCELADLTLFDNRDVGDRVFIDLIKLISKEFSTPHFAGHNYAFTQYLAGQFMNMDFDGVIFRSSLDKYGRNYVFFDPDCCEAIDSRLYKVTDIAINAIPIGRRDV